MKTLLFLYLITFFSPEIKAQKKTETYYVDQKGVPLADSKNPYSLISLIRYNLPDLAKHHSFIGLSSDEQFKIQEWNRSNPKEKIVLNSFLRQSNEPLKNEKGENVEIPLPDGTITFKYKAPDTVYYSFDYNQISFTYSEKEQIPETIQLYKKTAKSSFLLAEFPTNLLTKNELATYFRVDPVTEKNYMEQYLKHVENTRFRFGENGISRLVIKDPWKYYWDEYAFFDRFLFDSLHTIADQKKKLNKILTKPINLVYDTTYYSLTNMFGDDSLIRDPEHGDLINVVKTEVDTLFSVNEIHAIYKKLRIDYNSKTNFFEIKEEAILICLEDLEGNQLIIEKISYIPYPYATAKEDISQRALKYDLNNNPLRKLLRIYLPGQLFPLEHLFQVKVPKQKREVRLDPAPMESEIE